MKLEPFRMERWQSLHERGVAHNLAESGVEPLALGDLLDEDAVRRLLTARLGYPETRGAAPLREVVADLYPDCGPENVLLTTGTSEANFLATMATVERDRSFVAVLPNYLQAWGLARSLGARVRELPLREEGEWQPDPEALQEAVARGVTAVSLSHPNNPTGLPLSAETRDLLADAAEDAGAWILSDEVYRGAERVGDRTPTLWGRTDRVLVTAGLSKAYGAPGLRLGWIVGPADFVEELWALHDYTTIAISTVTEVLGAHLLEGWRDRILVRARTVLRRNFPLLEAFVERTGLAWVPPRAGAIAFVRYPWALPSEDLAQRARREQDVLVVPGAHFGQEGYLRIGYGMEAETLEEGLAGLEEVFAGL